MPRLLVVTTIRVAFTISVLSRQYAGLSGQAYWRLSSTPLANQLRWVSAAGRLWLQDSPCWPSCRCPCWDIGHGSLIALPPSSPVSDSSYVGRDAGARLPGFYPSVSAR